MVKPVRAKAGLPWPVNGIYLCDKCHTPRTGQAGTIATRCAVLRGARQQQCNCAYFVLIEPGAPEEGAMPVR
jgi:hypothetical protein